MKKSILLLCTLFASFFTYSQQFEVGQIIRNGKAIEGFIKYQDWLKSPKTIEFKNLNNDKAEVIEAESIDGFSVHGEEFISKKVLVALSLNTEKEYNVLSKPVMLDGYYYLQVWLKNPKVNIYEMIDAKEEPHYFIEKDGLFQELFYSKQNLHNGNIAYIQEKKGYLGQLIALLADCPSIEVSEELLYQRKEILKLCYSYLACKGEKNKQITERVNNDKLDFSVGVTLGKLLSYDNKSNWIASLGLRMNFPKHFRNSYLLLEGNYYNFRENSGSYAYRNDELKVFGGSILIGTHFGSKNLRPFVNVGVSVIRLPEITNDGILGIGLSWKRNFKIEYREATASTLRQFNIGYMYNFK
ncbi:MAG: hypothetical protein V4585_16810 [Bacteroidota bacterium]